MTKVSFVFFNMRDLSVFVDESGDFGRCEKHAPYYLLTLVFHDQDKEITMQGFDELDRKLHNYFLPGQDTFVHSGPLIRRENGFYSLPLSERRHILSALLYFARRIPITYKTLIVDKRLADDDPMWLYTALVKKLNRFIDQNYEWLLSFSRIKIYYDRGQKEITGILNSVFHSRFRNMIMKDKKDDIRKYRLFQIADLICTLELLNIKHEKKCFNKAEMIFFENYRSFHNNYYRMIAKKKI